MITRLAAALADRYHIVRELGQGGMATVFLAEDLKHKRKVALKVLKPELAAVLGAERFVQEITTTAALQHPHILPLFDSGEADGFLYYVMPFIDGETLRAKLDRETQLGVDEAVKITSDVADALQYAHEHGVIHRDIKPENILLANGRPMVADFGIALAVSAAAGGRMTETGLSLGTPHYMSPEQATAEKEISARSDVYSLASVCYEMLAGQPPHLGGSAQQIIMKIIAEPVAAVTQFRKTVPPNVAAALDMALEKLPADRFASATAFAEAIRNPAFRGGVAQQAATRSARPLMREPVVLGLAAVAIVSLVALAVTLGRGPDASPTPVTRFPIEFDGEQQGGPAQKGSVGAGFAIAPDGGKFAYLGAAGANAQILVRTREQLAPEAVPSTTDVRCCMSFSPDGQSLAYLTLTLGVKTVSLQSGVTRMVVDSGVQDPSIYGSGIDWAPDGRIYVTMTGGLSRFPADGGAGERVATNQPGVRAYAWADALPNGKGALVTVIPSAVYDQTGYVIGAMDFATGAVSTLVKGVFARYAASGHLVFLRDDGSMMAAPFDQDRLALGGDIVTLDTGVVVGLFGSGQMAVSDSGTLILRRGRPVVNAVRVVRRDGTMEAARSPELDGQLDNPRLSPDGLRLAVARAMGEGQHIVSQALAGGEVLRLTFEGQRNTRFIWPHAGRNLFFTSDRDGSGAVFVTPVDGTGTTRRVMLPETRVIFDVLAVDDSTLVIRTDNQAAGSGDILLVHLGIDTTVTPLIATPAAELSPAISPDRKWMAYQSDESGRPEVYVRPLPPRAGGAIRVSLSGGTEPAWAHSGRALFYRDGAGGLVSAAVTMAPTFSVQRRQVLFPASTFRSNTFSRQYDVFPDDQRFLMLLEKAPDDPNETIVVLNWFEELRRRVVR